MQSLRVSTSRVALAVVFMSSGAVFGQPKASTSNSPPDASDQPRAAQIANQLKAWELGLSFGKAVVDATTEIRIVADLHLDDAKNLAKERGVRLPSLPANRSDKSAHAVFLRAEGIGQVYRNIVAQHGQQAADLYRWGVYVHNAKLAIVERLVTDQHIEQRINEVLAECRLPKSLGEPMIAESRAWNAGQLDRAIERVASRVSYLITEVRANGRPDTELNDPNIESVIRDSIHRRNALALRKAVEQEGTAEAKTILLLKYLANPPDAYVIPEINKCLRDLGTQSLMTICSVVPNNVDVLDEASWRSQGHILTALNFVLFGEIPDLWRTEANSKRSYSAPCIAELVRCASSNAAAHGAQFALSQASLATNGRVIPELLKLRTGSEKAMDSLLEQVALAHMLRAFESIDRFAARGDFTDEPSSAYLVDLDVVRGIPASARGAVAMAEKSLIKPAEQRRNAEVAVEMKREFVESVREALGDLSPERIEQRNALRLWTRAIRQAMSNAEVKTKENLVTIYDVQIDRLEQLIGRSVTRRHSASGPFAMFTLELKETALRAGQFAAEQAMMKDLQSAIRARDDRLSDYIAAVEAVAFQTLSPDDRQRVLKYRLAKNPNLANPESKAK